MKDAERLAQKQMPFGEKEERSQVLFELLLIDNFLLSFIGLNLETYNPYLTID